MSFFELEDRAGHLYTVNSDAVESIVGVDNVTLTLKSGATLKTYLKRTEALELMMVTSYKTLGHDLAVQLVCKRMLTKEFSKQDQLLESYLVERYDTQVLRYAVQRGYMEDITQLGGPARVLITESGKKMVHTVNTDPTKTKYRITDIRPVVPVPLMESTHES